MVFFEFPILFEFLCSIEFYGVFLSCLLRYCSLSLYLDNFILSLLKFCPSLKYWCYYKYYL